MALTPSGGLNYENQELKALVPQGDGTNAKQVVILEGASGVGSQSIAYPVPVTFANAGVDSSSIAYPVLVSGYTYINSSSNATSVLKSGTGTFHAVVTNTAGTSSTLTVYDNTAGSGTKIATIDTTILGDSFEYDANFTTGLTIVSAGVAAANVTVMYR